MDCSGPGFLSITDSQNLFKFVSFKSVMAFNPFTFKVIIDKYDPITIYFIVLGPGLYTLSVFPV